MKKIITLLFIASTGFALSSCGERYYIVVWQDSDGKVLRVDEKVKEGTIPNYGISPTKEKTDEYSYVFNKWTPSISPVTEHVTYVASYTAIANLYTVEWRNYDNSLLEKDENVLGGSLPSYDGEDPTRPGAYKWTGWDKQLVKVTGNVTYTATYEEVKETYTVIWNNYDGSQLEKDVNVPYGSDPSYDGDEPTRPGYYQFIGWTPKLDKVTKDITYTAEFVNVEEDIPGVVPKVSQDGSKVTYGLYPQTRISDASLIEELEKAPRISSGWYLYNNRFYAKETAEVFNGESYTFDDGTSIINGTDYWYSCDPISWTVLEQAENQYCLLADSLLETSKFYLNFNNRTISDTTIYPNNYANSILRRNLDGFLNQAFFLNKTNVTSIYVDNSASSTESSTNPYACESFNDQISCLSFQEANALPSNYRIAKTSEYVRASGAWCSKDKNYLHNGTYWLRSPSATYCYASNVVNAGGTLSSYPVNEECYCIRPIINIQINN